MDGLSRSSSRYTSATVQEMTFVRLLTTAPLSLNAAALGGLEPAPVGRLREGVLPSRAHHHGCAELYSCIRETQRWQPFLVRGISGAFPGRARPRRSGRAPRRDQCGVHSRAGIGQQKIVAQQVVDHAQHVRCQIVLLEPVAKAQDRALVGKTGHQRGHTARSLSGCRCRCWSARRRSSCCLIEAAFDRTPCKGGGIRRHLPDFAFVAGCRGQADQRLLVRRGGGLEAAPPGLKFLGRHGPGDEVSLTDIATHS